MPEDRAEDRAETLAHHYLTAIELRRAAGEDVGDVGARAVGALQEAGERALALSAFRTAAGFLDAALELVPADAEPRPSCCSRGAASGMVGRDGRGARAGERGVRADGRLERAAEAAVAASWHLWHVRPGDASRSSSVPGRS